MSLKPHASLTECPPELNKKLARSITNQPTMELSQRPCDYGRPLDKFFLLQMELMTNGDILKHHLVPSRAVHVIQTRVIYSSV